MTRELVVDELALEEAEAQTRYYLARAGDAVAARFAAELEICLRALAEGRLVGVNHPRVAFRLPIKRVFLDRFPFAVVFYVEPDTDTVTVVAVEALRKRPGYWRSRLHAR
jgi:plasmid stabilization system protein ParE